MSLIFIAAEKILVFFPVTYLLLFFILLQSSTNLPINNLSLLRALHTEYNVALGNQTKFPERKRMSQSFSF